jgi:formate-dependent nitrite reductase membrane component NrfD
MQERRKGGRAETAAWKPLALGGAPLNQRRPSGLESVPAYYAYPPLKRPHWRWEVVLYFFLGGLASASFVIATIADWLGAPEDRAISRVGRYLALAGMLATPPLLIRDLGRPERFVNMLRLVKPRSPMSMGSWAITAFGLAAGLAAVGQGATDGWLGGRWPARQLARLPQRPLGLIGGGLAAFVAAYTGVLLAFTNVPFWARNRLWIGPLFLSSALSSGLAAIALVLEMGRRPPHAAIARLQRADVLALTAELGVLAASEATLGPLARPVTHGRLGRSYRLGLQGLGLVLPLLLQLPAYRQQPLPRPVGGLASLLVLGGGLVLRWLYVEAGKLSADDPAAYFAMAGGDPMPAAPPLNAGVASPLWGPPWGASLGAAVRTLRSAPRPWARGTAEATRQITGVVTIAQEDRIRVIDADGRGYLFVVGKHVTLTQQALWALARDQATVTVVYRGEPDLGAVALAVRPVPGAPTA